MAGIWKIHGPRYSFKPWALSTKQQPSKWKVRSLSFCTKEKNSVPILPVPPAGGALPLQHVCSADWLHKVREKVQAFLAISRVLDALVVVLSRGK